MKNTTSHNWHEWFTYEPATGLLRWKKCTSATGSGPNQPGKLAGTIHHYGYRVVNLHKRMYQQHRIVWEMHNGPIPPGLTIDHIDRDGLNNRLDNLRLADATLQNSNRKQPLRCHLTGRILPKSKR